MTITSSNLSTRLLFLHEPDFNSLSNAGKLQTLNTFRLCHEVPGDILPRHQLRRPLRSTTTYLAPLETPLPWL